MPSQRERTRTSLFVAVSALVIGAGLMLLAAVFRIGGMFYDISAYVYGASAFLGSVVIGLLIFQNVHAYLRESKVAHNMIAVDAEDRIFESRVIGEAVVRTPVVGVNTQVITIAPAEYNAPYVQRTPIQLTHLANDLPAVEDLSEQGYRQFVKILQGNGHENGKEK